MTANELLAESDANCPAVSLTLSGEDKDTTETLLEAGYTDGYTAEVELTFGTDYYAVMTDGTSVQAASFLARTDDDYTVSATANPYGAWFAQQTWTISDATGYASDSFYIPNLEVAIATDSTGFVDLSAETDELYGTTCDVASDDQLEGDSVTYSFYMPTSSDDSEEGPTATTGTIGDRLDKGTTVAYYSSVGDSSTVNAAYACVQTSEELVLGASALVAGSVAFAAALAF